MLFDGISMVKVMSSPDMVPRNAPGIRPIMPEPAKLIEPITVEPLWVSCHVIAPMSACPIMLPGPIELLESDPVPAHVPANDAEAAGVVVMDGAVEELAPHAAANDAITITMSAFVILPSFFYLETTS